MKRFSLILIAMLFSATAFAQQQFNTDFTQIKETKASGKTVNKAGHIVYDGNNQLSLTYTDPQGDYFIIDGQQVKINLDGKKNELNTNKVKTLKLQCSTLMNCLSGNWEQAANDNNADLTITEKNGNRNVLIKAKGKVPRGGYAFVELSYRTADNSLVKMVLEDAKGIINTYQLK